MYITHTLTPTHIYTFCQLAVLGRLAGGQDGLDEDADAALRRIPAADNGEAQRFSAVTLLEDDRVEGRRAGGRMFEPPWKGAVAAQF